MYVCMYVCMYMSVLSVCLCTMCMPCLVPKKGRRGSQIPWNWSYRLLQATIRVFRTGAGEMAQWVRAPDCSSEGPEFKSQQPHGGSQPSVQLQCTHIHKINKYFKICMCVCMYVCI